MKKIAIFLTSSLLMLLLTVQYSHASISIQEVESYFDFENFKMNLAEVNQVINTNTYMFRFATSNTKNPEINHWEMRVWCDAGMKVSIGTISGVDRCNGENTVLTESPENFRLFLTEADPKARSFFSFKLKAFDKTGKWIHSEKQVFQW